MQIMSLIFIVVFALTVLSTGLSAFSGDLYAHDPSLIRSGHCYYIFSSNNVVNPGNIPLKRLCNDVSVRVGEVFHTTPNWLHIFTKIPTTNGNMWAPDVSYFNDQYYVYYAASSAGSRNSVIAFATAKNIEGPYVDQGEVLHTTDALQYNAIDPEIAWTYKDGKKDQLWLVFGSYWEGIKARRLDPKTGHLSNEDTKLYSLAHRTEGDNSIEASSVAYRNGFYYLFVSFDKCCNGVNSNYRIMVGRSQHLTGPYVDRSGRAMMNGGGTQILATHGAVHGPGGCDVILDGNVHRMVYHWYDGNDGGKPKYDIVDLVWSPDNWPSVGPQSKLNYH